MIHDERPRQIPCVINGEETTLTWSELKILLFLIENAKKWVPMRQIEDVCQIGNAKVHVHRLRQKIPPNLIQNRPQFGYRVL